MEEREFHPLAPHSARRLAAAQSIGIREHAEYIAGISWSPSRGAGADSGCRPGSVADSSHATDEQTMSGHGTAMATLLFVSGNRTWRNMARMVLRGLPCVVAFADGTAARELVRDANNSRVFVDARIPHCRRLLETLDAEARAPRVVLLTSNGPDGSHGPAALARHPAVRAAYECPATAANLVELVLAEFPGTDGIALLDAALVAELRAALGPGVARVTLLDDFTREVESLWQQAEAARADGGRATLRATLHRLRGAVASMGACALDARLATLEPGTTAADSMHWADCRALLDVSVVALRTVLAGRDEAAR
jgi:hypothetical protein